MRAGLKRHVHSRPSRIIAALGTIGQRSPLRVQIAQFGMPPLTGNLAIPHNNSSDERIGANSPPPALRKLQRVAEMLAIRACELGFHETD